MHLLLKLSCLILLLAATSGCESISAGMAHSAGGGSGITVFAAASTTNAMEEITEDFTRTTGVQVRTNYAASSTLAQQIVNGAEPDVFLSANASWAEHVDGSASRHRDLLGNRLVIVVPSGSRLSIREPEGLLLEEVEHLAVADTDSVPAGRYARQALEALGLWEKLKGKVVPSKDVRHALMYVETGAAEAGIVYATDAAVSDRVKVAAEIPAGLTERVVYPALLLKHGAGNRAAEEFYEFLDSPEATRIFEKYGFNITP